MNWAVIWFKRTFDLNNLDYMHSSIVVWLLIIFWSRFCLSSKLVCKKKINIISYCCNFC